MKRKFANWNLLAGAVLMTAAMCISAMLSGCASTNTVLRLGVHADVTDIRRGCDRNRDFGCGIPGPREQGIVEILWAPSIKPGPYCSYLHGSHTTAGEPFNDRFEGSFDSVGCGGFLQFNDRQ